MAPTLSGHSLLVPSWRRRCAEKLGNPVGLDNATRDSAAVMARCERQQRHKKPLTFGVVAGGSDCTPGHFCEFTCDLSESNGLGGGTEPFLPGQTLTEVDGLVMKGVQAPSDTWCLTSFCQVVVDATASLTASASYLAPDKSGSLYLSASADSSADWEVEAERSFYPRAIGQGLRVCEACSLGVASGLATVRLESAALFPGGARAGLRYGVGAEHSLRVYTRSSQDKGKTVAWELQADAREGPLGAGSTTLKASARNRVRGGRVEVHEDLAWSTGGQPGRLKVELRRYHRDKLASVRLTAAADTRW